MLKDFTDELMKAIVETLRSSDEKVKQGGVKHGILLLQTIIPKLEQKEREKLSNDLESLLRDALKDSDRIMGLVEPPNMKCGLEKIKVEEPK